MKTVAVISRKGGSGKTTITVHLAVAAQKAGLQVGVIDLDPQQSAASWGDERPSGPDVISAQHVRLPKVLEAAREGGADLIIVDTPASNSDIPQYAAMHADVVLVPTRASRGDVESNFASHSTASSHGKCSYVVFNDEPNRRATVIEECKGILQERGLKWAPIVIKSRTIYDEAVSQGSTALEVGTDSKATAEITELFEWLTEILNLSTKLLDSKSDNPQSVNAVERSEV